MSKNVLSIYFFAFFNVLAFVIGLITKFMSINLMTVNKYQEESHAIEIHNLEVISTVSFVVSIVFLVVMSIYIYKSLQH